MYLMYSPALSGSLVVSGFLDFVVVEFVVVDFVVVDFVVVDFVVVNTTIQSSENTYIISGINHVKY